MKWQLTPLTMHLMGLATETLVSESYAETFQNVACTRCGCVCDDLSVTVRNGRVLAAEGACELAETWFLEHGHANHSAAEIDGSAVELPSAISRAAHLLRRARNPLIYGLSRSSTRGQRTSIRLADRIGATIDTTASQCHGPSIMAIQQVGESTCSLGEAKNRCDLVIFWGCDPVNSHPRHAERYSVYPTGMFLPRGRADRHVMVIDHKRTATAELADTFIRLPSGQDFDFIWGLRYALRGGRLRASVAGHNAEALVELSERLKSCRSGIVYFGLGLAQSKLGHITVEALLRLVTELNAHTRFYARRMRIPGDVTGADSVLCWQTGFPFAVNLARGYPRYNPGEYSANEVLGRHEADACLLLGSEDVDRLDTAAQDWLHQIPTIVLDNPQARSAIDASVHFTTSVYGVHTPGTAYRMDEVPIPLTAFLPRTYPTDHEILTQIMARLPPV